MIDSKSLSLASISNSAFFIPSKEVKFWNVFEIGSNILFITDKDLMSLKLTEPTLNQLKKFSSKVEIFEDVEADPSLKTLLKSIEIGKHEKESFQHVGLGKKLMAESERIAKDEFSSRRLLVISAIGTREYYQKLGYKIYGPYVSKELI